MRRQLVATVLSYLVVAFSFCGPALTGATIAGTVVTDGNQPIAAALILHDLSTSRVYGSTPFDHEFASKTDGTFALDGVPEGKYEICVESIQHLALDPCFWDAPQAHAFEVKDAGNGRGGGASAQLGIRVKQGYLLQVTVNDPQGVLPLPTKGSTSSPLLLRIQTNSGKGRNLRLLSHDSGGENHFVIIPYDTPLHLHVSSATVKLSDEHSTPFAGNSSTIEILVPQGKGVPPVVINTGKQ